MESGRGHGGKQHWRHWVPVLGLVGSLLVIDIIWWQVGDSWNLVWLLLFTVMLQAMAAWLAVGCRGPARFGLDGCALASTVAAHLPVLVQTWLPVRPGMAGVGAVFFAWYLAVVWLIAFAAVFLLMRSRFQRLNDTAGPVPRLQVADLMIVITFIALVLGVFSRWGWFDQRMTMVAEGAAGGQVCAAAFGFPILGLVVSGMAGVPTFALSMHVAGCCSGTTRWITGLVVFCAALSGAALMEACGGTRWMAGMEGIGLCAAVLTWFTSLYLVFQLLQVSGNFGRQGDPVA